MSECKLADVYENPAVQAFGRALNLNLRNDRDYASLADLEYAERPEQFADFLKRFLRRYEVPAARREREGKGVFRPSDEHVRQIADLVDKVGVAPVRAALIAYALVWHERTTPANDKEAATHDEADL